MAASATSASATASSAASEAASSLPHPEPIEEDDEFEEFGEDEYTEAPGADEEALWQGDWDDEEPDDDFVSQLRAELAKTAASSSSSTA